MMVNSDAGFFNLRREGRRPQKEKKNLHQLQLEKRRQVNVTKLLVVDQQNYYVLVVVFWWNNNNNWLVGDDAVVASI